MSPINVQTSPINNALVVAVGKILVRFFVTLTFGQVALGRMTLSKLLGRMTPIRMTHNRLRLEKMTLRSTLRMTLYDIKKNDYSILPLKRRAIK